MPVAGARALLSASRSASSPRRPPLPRVAVAKTSCPLCLVGQARRPPTTAGPVRGTRSLFGASRPSRPDDSDPGDAGKDGDGTNDKLPPEKGSTPTPDTAKSTEVTKETLRGQGYGSARARAFRTRAEELPSVQVPDWFRDRYVVLQSKRKPASIPPLEEEDRDTLLQVLESELERHAIRDRHVERFEGIAQRVADGTEESTRGLDSFSRAIARSAHYFRISAMYTLLALGHNDLQNAELRPRFRDIHNWFSQDDMQHPMVLASDDRLSETAKRWLTHVDPIDGPEGVVYHGSPLAHRHDEREWTVSKELLTTLRAELLAQTPETRANRDLNRPVTVLSVLNYKGRIVAKSVVEDVATNLGADVVFLDALSIARIIGGYLGQSPYWSRGPLAMLGYGAAELNGRQIPRSAQGEPEMEVIALGTRHRNFGSKRDFGLSTGSSDDRWDDLKLNHALEKLVTAADDLAATSGHSSSDRLIIHIHDYAEITALSENIINKLRSIVDRMWQKGRKAIIVGSTSSDATKPSQWSGQLAELTREDCHIVPFHASDMDGAKDELESLENWRENLVNIRTMIQALDPAFATTYAEEYNFEKVVLSAPEMKLAKKQGFLQSAPLAQTVYDVQWVYRYVSLLLGSRTPGSSRDILMDVERQEHVLKLMAKDKNWADLYPNAKAPYFSPLPRPRTFPVVMDPEDRESWSPAPEKVTAARIPKDLNANEKALLSGLIDAKDIHTTFDDIIVPAATKDSLKALTSLSLIRPDAFSYGVLKTERIPGCLLYGPPGNGKTLLAKAVAKESGAHMLEVSAASVNDRWLGQSEKNVRAIFSLARKMAPMVIFLDEADALLSARSGAQQRPAHRETITQFLREWDGLSEMRAFIMVATNRPFDLDEAVLRRLPRRILIDLPLRTERESILRVILRDETLSPDVDLGRLAAQTELYSGSDLKNLCVAAAMEAVREENRAKDIHTGPDEFVFPERRVLMESHFKTAMREISASISEDMESLKAIRKFDSQYGDAGKKAKRRRSMGFEVVPGQEGSEAARVRQGAGENQMEEVVGI
ncbi:AAA-domain-containing protein [Thozetella sp. PMI_491]|nr:AAA-domain-containing protein [Thozetella sp. PMI_491]